jgi:hypothetical protein
VLRESPEESTLVMSENDMHTVKNGADLLLVEWREDHNGCMILFEHIFIV